MIRPVLALLLAASGIPSATRAAVNLVGQGVARPAVGGDCASLAFAGNLEVTVRNVGADDGTAPFDVLVFQDQDGDELYSAGTDGLLGTASALVPLLAGETRAVSVTAAGPLVSRDPLFFAWIDSGVAQAESDEADNVTSSRVECERGPPATAFEAVLEWEWTEAPVDSTPIIGDVNADGTPDVVFSSELELLHALDGRTGLEIWRSTGPPFPAMWVSVAIGELDGDPGLETVALASDASTLIAFDDDGSWWWTSDALPSPVFTAIGGVTLADLDCDGVPEAIFGKDVFDATSGRLYWTPEPGGTQGTNDTFHGFSTPADVDGDGDLELIAGPTAYAFDPLTSTGRIVWTQPAVPEGFTAIGEFDADPAPEVVVVHLGRIWLLEGDTGAVVWEAAIPQGGGGCSAFTTRAGAPTVADFNGDGAAEIGVAGADWYVVFEGDGSEKWRAPIDDCSSSFTSSTVFDFEDDGAAEVVYQDESAVHVFRGTDGSELVALPASSLTWTEMVTIADVDGDDRAEIISPNNQWNGRTEQGIRAWGDRNDNWVDTRRIWNQNAYHVDNVGDDGRIPAATGGACETPSWQTHNTYRLQSAGNVLRGDLPDLSPHVLSLGADVTDPCNPRHELRVLIGNGGAVAIGRATDAWVYDGDPASGGLAVASFQVSDLLSGSFEVARVLLPPTLTGDLHVVVDDDGTGTSGGVITECREANNACSATVAGDPTTYPEPLGPFLRAFAHGSPYAADISGSFQWSGDDALPRPPGDHYHLMRSTRPDALALVPGTEPLTALTWVDVTPRATSLPLCHYLQVLAVDQCERVAP